MSTIFSEAKPDSIELLIVPEHGTVYTNQPVKSNKVTTTKYTWWNFLPLNLWQQLTTLANLYFIFIGILQTLKWTTTSNGVPTILTPLTTITVISGFRAAVENIQASQSDTKRNKALFWQIASKIPNYFDQKLKEISKNPSSPKDAPLLGVDSDTIQSNDANTPLATHPSTLLHRFYSAYPTLSRKLRRRWLSWETMKPSTSAQLPGLTLSPQQTTYAFKALQPRKKNALQRLFTSDDDDEEDESKAAAMSPIDSIGSSSDPSSPAQQYVPYATSFGNEDSIISPGLQYQSPATMRELDEIANANAVHQRKAMLQSNSTLELVHSGDIRPGSILKIYKNQMIPADMILLGTSEQRNHCFIDKANLNGETQLEVMNGIPFLKPYFGYQATSSSHSSPPNSPSPQQQQQHSQQHTSSTNTSSLTLQTNNNGHDNVNLAPPKYGTMNNNGHNLSTNNFDTIDSSAPYYDIDLYLRYDLPSADFEQFRGVLSVYSHTDPSKQPTNIPVGSKQLLLRETVLRNSDYIYGLVVYTGDDTKIRRSIVEENQKGGKKGSGGNEIKTSRLLHVINRLVAILFVVQLILCFIAGISYSLWTYQFAENHWYLRLESTLEETLLGALFSSLSWMIMVNTFVPISLLVTLEMTRFFTSLVVEWDVQLYDTTINRTAKCNTTTVHDDLGMVDVVFSDKTGTLTQNKQELRYLSIAIHENNDVQTIITKDEYDTIDGTQVKWRPKTAFKAQPSVFIKPLKSTTAFEAFGSLQTEIAIKVKNKKSGKVVNLLKTHLTTKDGSLLSCFRLPSTHPLSYQGLPPRWTASLVEHGLLQPLRLYKGEPKKKTNKKKGNDDDDDDNEDSTAVPALRKHWKLSRLMANAYKHNAPFYEPHLPSNHDSNQHVTRKTYSIFSYLWNTAQGHAYYQWFLALQRAQVLKLAQDEIDKKSGKQQQHHQYVSPLSTKTSSTPSSRSRTPQQQSQLTFSSTNTNTNGIDGTSVHATRKSASGFVNTSVGNTRQQQPQAHRSPLLNPTNNNESNQPTNGLLPINEGTSSPGGSSTRLQEHEMTLFAQHTTPAQQNEFFEDDNDNDEPQLISTYTVSRSLHQLAHSGMLQPQQQHHHHHQQQQQPQQQQKQPSGIQVYNRLLFEKDYYLPIATLLGSFRADSRTAILTALWSKNWAHQPAYQSSNIYIAPYNVRQHLYRYIRSMALSSTVKAYRKPDGTMDWQYESAEEYAMVRFAASLGFYRDVHPSGEGTVLYVREWYSPDFGVPDLNPIWRQIQQSGIQNLPSDDGIPSATTPHSSTSPNTNNSTLPSNTHGGSNSHVKLHTFKKFESKIHAEVYNSLGVCGFSSQRARVSIILQRSPQATFPIMGSYTPNQNGTLLEFDTVNSLEGYNTMNQYSTYMSEYDRSFRDQSKLPVPIHPFDDLTNNDGKDSPTYQQYPDQALIDTLQFNETNAKKHIHVLTKGQDSTTVPLLHDTVMTPQLAQLPNYAVNGDVGLFASQSTYLGQSSAAITRDPHCNTLPYNNPHHILQHQLHEMENSSLRCLVAAYSELPNEWWTQFEALFAFVAELDVDTALPVTSLQELVGLIQKHPNTSPSQLAALVATPNTTGNNSKNPNNNINNNNNNNNAAILKAVEIRHLTYQLIEESASLTLLGCFGMEDQLQTLVPETIRDLRRAGVRVWMITGDKLDVAKNIALACELIDADMLSSTETSISVQKDNDSFASGALSHTYSNLGRYESNLININTPDLFPLCIRQHPSSRLINVTGEWLLNFRTNRDKLMSEVFTALTEYDENTNVLVELGYLQQCLLHVGLDLTLSQLGTMFVLSREDIPIYVTNVSATTTITRERFVEAMNAVGDSISDRDSIFIDVETGLNVYRGLFTEHQGDLSLIPPIALLVNRNAFNIMFENDDEAEQSQLRFQQQRQDMLTTERKKLQEQLEKSPQSMSPPQQHSPLQNSPIDEFATGFLNPTSPVPSQRSSSPLSSPSSTTRRLAPPSQLEITKKKKKIDNADIPWLAQKFFSLSLFAKSVVFARAEPAMKKKMVTSIKALTPEATTLAIGDGANDTDMITAAHIGIGIAGVEGTAATNSADYAIGTFRMLHNLLLVHGLTYSRIEKIILLMFYKGAMLAIAHFCYGFHNSFNGSSLFNDMLYQLYNIVYTSWCVLLLIQHQPLPKPVLQNSPAVYRQMKSNSFTLSRFAYWMMKAVVHALIIFYLPLLPFFYEANEQIGSFSPIEFVSGMATGQRGRVFSLAHVSTLSMAAFAILPNIMAAFMMESIQLPFASVVTLSALSFFGAFVTVTYFRWTAGEQYHDLSSTFLDPQFWLRLVLILAIPVILEFVSHYISHYWVEYPGLVQILKERIRTRRLQVKWIDTNFIKHAKINKLDTSLDITTTPAAAQNATSGGYSRMNDGGNDKLFTTIDMHASQNSRLHSSTTSTRLTPDKQPYFITSNPYADVATTAENSINTSLDVQLKGCDPDPDGLFSAALWGEAGGYGVRASQADEITVSNPYFNPNDKMNNLTQKAETMSLKLSHNDPKGVFVPLCIELSNEYNDNVHTLYDQRQVLTDLGLYSAFDNPQDVLSRTMALRVFRLLSLLTQSLDTDQQLQQKPSKQRRNAMSKQGVAHYKRDRFQQGMSSSSAAAVSKYADPTLVSTPIFVTDNGTDDDTDGNLFTNNVTGLTSSGSYMVDATKPRQQQQNIEYGAIQLHEDPQYYHDNGDNNGIDGDSDDDDDDNNDPSTVTVSTSRSFQANLKGDHFVPNGGKKKNGKKK